MTVALTINGSTYNYPENQDENWGTVATQWATAVTNGMLQKAGGNFTLLADVNFGATYGLVSGYFKSRSSNISTTGVLRLANNEGVGFRNAANGADKIFKLDGSDKWAFGSTALSEAELALLASVTGTLVTTDGTQTLTNKTISRSSNTLTNLNIVNADVDAAAAIALSKLATLTASRALVSSGAGAISVSTVTSTELGLLSGVTGTLVTTAASQTLTNKTLTTPIIASFISNGVTFTNPTADGSSGQVIQTNGSGALSFASVVTNPMTTKGDLISTSTGSNVTRTAVGSDGALLLARAAATSGLDWTSGLSWDFTNSRLGIGTTAPSSKLSVNLNSNNSVPTLSGPGIGLFGTDSTATNIQVVNYAVAGGFNTYRANGTQATPTAVASGNQIGIFGARGYDGSAYTTGSRAAMIINASESWTGSAQGADLEFYTTPNASTTIASRFKISNAGELLPTNIHNNGGSTGGTQAISSGTYSPSVSNQVNITTQTTYDLQWMRVGKVVTVSGRMDITPTATSGAAYLRMTLPFTNGNFAAAGGAAGGGGVDSFANNGYVVIVAVSGGTTVFVQVAKPLTTASHQCYFTFSYLLS